MEPLTADDPRQLSIFILQARLGAGGMGRVYLGSSPGGRAVAVKVVHPELARDPEFMRRFRREVEAAEAVSGVYTAPVIDAGPDDSPPWLATAYVPGPSLAELVNGAGPMPEAAVWRLAGGLTEALQAIHGRGLVHRDLKPGNILIAADGPRVIDFGISRALHGVTITGTRTTMGTPAYMSPEQAASREIGPASDIFSLGSVLAFAATGTAPFDGSDMLSVIYRIVHSDPDLSRLPPALGRLVAGCLAKDPAGRPSLRALLGSVTVGSASFQANARGQLAPGQFWPDQVAAAIAGRPVPPPVTQNATPVTAPAARPPVTTGPPRTEPATVPRRGPSGRWLLVIGAASVVAAAVGVTLAMVSPGSTGSLHTAGQTPPAHSAASTTPLAAASPTASLTAATVCVVPADACTPAGEAPNMEVRPNQIMDSGDGSGYLKDLVWSHWGSPQATATGTQVLNTCTPNCAQGKYADYPATVTLAGLTPYGTDHEAYSTIVIQSPDAGTTETYTTGTVP
jgi:serine/threonine protein kinase